MIILTVLYLKYMHFILHIVSLVNIFSLSAFCIPYFYHLSLIFKKSSAVVVNNVTIMYFGWQRFYYSSIYKNNITTMSIIFRKKVDFGLAGGILQSQQPPQPKVQDSVDAMAFYCSLNSPGIGTGGLTLRGLGGTVWVGESGNSLGEIIPLVIRLKNKAINCQHWAREQWLKKFSLCNIQPLKLLALLLG